ncbi:MAG: extracellular solute-binding protein [Actinobacteria bacterium]|nr:extracellular solute-binding protein [Actinomycetota bacterium]
MKKIIFLLLVILFTVSMLFMGSGCKEEAAAAEEETAGEEAAPEEEEMEEAEEPEEEAEVVTLKYTSLRTEDVDRVNRINAVFMEKYPNIIVEFEPVKNTEYDAYLKTSLETGVGADIVMLRSYDGGRQIYDGGYLVELNDMIPNFDEFTGNSVGAWKTEDGVIYGVPYFGSITGVWYNKDIFAEYNLKPPAIWDELLSICGTLKDNGEVVFAHGTNEPWVLTETLYCDLGPNFYGGEESRQKLINREIKFTDERFIKAFDALYGLVDYFPVGYEAIDYVTMQQMFCNEQAAMFIAGSWELGVIEDAGVNAGWFGPPVENEGDRMQYAFYADLALGINKDSPHVEEALTYLKWVATAEHASLLANELPGMYPTMTIDFKIDNTLSQDIIDIAKRDDVDTTGQLMWEKLSSQEPSGAGLLDEVCQKFLNGDMTSTEAVEYVQKGLDTWYFTE